MRHNTKTKKAAITKITPKEAEESLAAPDAGAVNIDLMPKMIELLTAIHSTLLKIQEGIIHPAPTVTSRAGDMVVVKETPFANGKGKIIDVEPAPKTAKEEVVETAKDGIGMTVPLSTLREAASKYAAKYGMNELLEKVVRYGTKKINEVPEESRDALYKDLQEKLVEDIGTEKEHVDPKNNLGLEDLKKVGGDFINKNGPDAFKQLIKTFGAAKLSEVKPEKYAALHEALTNA
jgi:hypothetical protein